ncbi:MAG: hypothetical protein BJ554DRAFT_1754 [Olpidium bornovanus]|uniref:Uncharacterized protein n=1 Tax=Olpidium bornovanus TaxID=278681 RepID=A0A8H7ZRA4_9FUNG|nr:MAG: hypothetical protein BJ554DRAFT_1754 [Olpidium bornovanus]
MSVPPASIPHRLFFSKRTGTPSAHGLSRILRCARSVIYQNHHLCTSENQTGFNTCCANIRHNQKKECATSLKKTTAARAGSPSPAREREASGRRRRSLRRRGLNVVAERTARKVPRPSAVSSSTRRTPGRCHYADGSVPPRSAGRRRPKTTSASLQRTARPGPLTVAGRSERCVSAEETCDLNVLKRAYRPAAVNAAARSASLTTLPWGVWHLSA